MNERESLLASDESGRDTRSMFVSEHLAHKRELFAAVLAAARLADLPNVAAFDTYECGHGATIDLECPENCQNLGDMKTLYDVLNGEVEQLCADKESLFDALRQSEVWTEEQSAALVDIAEAADDILTHGLDHPSGQIKMMDGSVQPCLLCLALDRLKATG